MARTRELTKRVAIDKTNTQMVIVVAVASFITVFCLFASKTLLSQNSYQARVKSAQQIAENQLQQNLNDYANLKSRYSSFIASPKNAIGGQTYGTGSSDGNNAKIVLDALPATYDFPALATSIDKIITNAGLKVTAITGTDEEATEQNNVSSADPTPVAMPFSFTVADASYQSVGQLLKTLQASIRPIVIDSINLSGASDSMNLSVQAHTFFQPSKSISITQEAVK